MDIHTVNACVQNNQTTTPQHHNTTTPQHHNTTIPQHHNTTTPKRHNTKHQDQTEPNRTKKNKQTKHTEHTNYTKKAFDSSVTVVFALPLVEPQKEAIMATFDGSSARRRRERRLRMHLRHERLSVAMALAGALNHSSGSPENDRRRVGVAQHGAVRGQTTATRARGPATQYFTFGHDEDVPAPGERLFWPQERDLRRSPAHFEEPTLDVPALQTTEEWGNGFQFAALLVLQQQISLELPVVPVSSAIGRVVQQENVEQVLDVPVLQTLDEDHDCGVGGAADLPGYS